MQQSRMSERNADTAKPLTAPLAVGGSLQPKVDIDLQGTASPTIELISARPDVATAADGKIVGRSPGVTAILITTKEGTVLDFHHLWVEQATRMTLHRQDDQARDLGEVLDGIDFLEGESIYVTPRVYFKSQELAGTVPGTWTIDPPVALLLKQGLADGRRLFAAKPGEATLTVSIPGVSVRVPIRVLPKTNADPPAPPPTPAPPAPGSTIGGL
jgi:hypothetical protein